ncbi:hypothetical protein evm_011734 [Chilo suppressalis]|nr:hypothetical protein evm_011734 [Chilo suppressalis]
MLQVVKAQLPHVSLHKRGEFIVRFTSSLPGSICYKELDGCEVEGQKLKVLPYEGQKQDTSKYKNKFERKGNDMKPKKKIVKTTTISSDQNTNETYGLSMNFLNSLGIKPPLINKIFVGNLSPQVDKEKLREVFGFAGTVTSVYLITTSTQKAELMKRSAKIEFDHPVEAVQAVSMFHQQELYGRGMVVQMDQHPHMQSLPDGLASLGPGLGPNGEPLKGIRHLVEIQPLKQLMSQELAELKARKSHEMAQTQANLLNANSSSLLGNPLHNIMTPLNVNTMNMNPLNSASSIFGITPAGLSQSQANIQSWQGLLQQHMGGDLATTLAALQTHNVNNKAVSGFAQPILPMGQNRPNTQTSTSNNGTSFDSVLDDRQIKPIEDKERNAMTSSDMLVFNNLPPSVTVQALNNKMREIGEIVFAEITGQGRAIVRFRSNDDADRCVKIFDRSKVDGQTIEVKFF